MASVQKLDQTAIKTGQGVTIALLLVAFIIGVGAWWIVALVALAQLMGALGLPAAPYRLLYIGLRRIGLLQPNLQPDHPEPHRFAMGIGAVFNSAAAISLIMSFDTIGWVLVWVVIALANLSFWVNFCAGCWMYYQLNRLGVPGFFRSKQVEVS